MAESLDSPVDYRSNNTNEMVHSALKELNASLCLGDKKTNSFILLMHQVRLELIVSSVNHLKKNLTISFMIIQRKLFFLIFTCLSAMAFSFSYVLGGLR